MSTKPQNLALMVQVLHHLQLASPQGVTTAALCATVGIAGDRLNYAINRLRSQGATIHYRGTRPHGRWHLVACPPIPLGQSPTMRRRRNPTLKRSRSTAAPARAAAERRRAYQAFCAAPDHRLTVMPAPSAPAALPFNRRAQPRVGLHLPAG